VGSGEWGVGKGNGAGFGYGYGNSYGATGPPVPWRGLPARESSAPRLPLSIPCLCPCLKGGGQAFGPVTRT